MTKNDKLLARFFSVPRDLTYTELIKILSLFGFEEIKTGKTSGSSVRFIRKEENILILFHRPHGKENIKEYVTKMIVEKLKENDIVK